MSRFVFITDTHIANSSNVRTGEYLNDVMAKLEWVVEYANEHNATILHGGDFYDKPSVPDIVKNKVMSVLKKANNQPLVIRGNHDILFNNTELSEKTSLENLYLSGIVREPIIEDFGDCIVTSRTDVRGTGKPIIILFHGFLNQEDGRNTFRYTDVDFKDKNIVLLGHDHVVYEAVVFENTTIIRPGSFTRGVRNDESSRTPQLVDITINGDDVQIKAVDIQCRDHEEIFKTKKFKESKREVANSYQSLITLISESGTKEESLESVVSKLATGEERAYIMEVLNQERIKKESK